MPSQSGLVAAVAARLEPRRLITGALTVSVVAAAGWWLVRPPSTPVDATLAVATTAAGSRSARSASVSGSTLSGGRLDDADVIVVHAAGAVVSPGVYKMPAGSRVSDLITTAGGPTPDGDPNALNLAGELRDGDRVAVPAVGQPVPAGGPMVGSSGLPGTAALVIDLNRGTVEEFDALPGIGPATAAAIVTYRDQHGSFGSVDDLLDVPGIGPAKLEALRELVDV